MLYDAFRPPTSRVREKGGVIARTAFLKAVEAVIWHQGKKLNHHEIPPLPDGDQAKDLAGIPIDHFWSKCEEYRPDDWALALYAQPSEGGRLVYQAVAHLSDGEDRGRILDVPHRITSLRQSPERALEELFYQLRDML